LLGIVGEADTGLELIIYEETFCFGHAVARLFGLLAVLRGLSSNSGFAGPLSAERRGSAKFAISNGMDIFEAGGGIDDAENPDVER
jgi:hypothetical protein